jgi:hypothetical protein
MGVRGLLKYLQRNPLARERRVSLSNLAYQIKDKTKGKTAKLLCDFFSILFWLLSEFHEAKIKRKDYQPYSYIYGGDVVEYEQRFLAFVNALRHLGIEPIFFVDGARGSNEIGFKAKLSTHRGRHLGKMARVVHCNQVAKYDPTEELETYSMWIPQPLVILHIMMTLKSEGVELVHCIGEADSYLAKRAQSGEEDICGILTNDTDLVVMRSCEVFLCQFFDRELKLGLRSVDFNSTPSDVVCEKLTPRRLADVIKIPERDLRNLSIICGNDYTEGLNERWKLHEKMSLSYPIVESAASWLRNTPHEVLDMTPPFDDIDSDSDGQYSRAIRYTYKAYAAITVSVDHVHSGSHRYRSYNTDGWDSWDDWYDDSPPLNSVNEMILAGVREGKMTRELLSMVTNSIHWRTGIVETFEIVPERAPLEGPKCIDDLLLPIRRMIYKLLNLHRVTEYGRSRASPYCRILVQVNNPSADLLNDLRLVKRTELERVCLFSTFLTKAHMLQDVRLTEFDHPMQLARRIDCTNLTTTLLTPLVVCIALLYSYDLRSESNTFSLDHVPDVFLVTCFMCILRKPPRKVLSRPSPEAAEIAPGFACIIEHSYHLASLLGLFEKMPLPAEMYQTAALIPFYQIATSKPSDIKHQLKSNKDLAETHSAFHFVTKELRSFKKLKDFLEEVHLSSKSSPVLVSPLTAFRLAIAFLDVLVDIDEADKQNKVFVQQDPSCVHGGKHSKQKRMSHPH